MRRLMPHEQILLAPLGLAERFLVQYSACSNFPDNTVAQIDVSITRIGINLFDRTSCLHPVYLTRLTPTRCHDLLCRHTDARIAAAFAFSCRDRRIGGGRTRK